MFYHLEKINYKQYNFQVKNKNLIEKRMIFKGIVKLSFLILNLKNKYINLINTNNHFLAKSLAQSSNQVIENYV